MNNVESVRKLNDRELELGISGTSASWHARYSHSAVVYVGGIPVSVTEGDIVTVFEQLGRLVHIYMPREDKTNKRRGFCFLEYKDQRSTILAVDNFNGAELYGSVLRVDHVDQYKRPDPGEVELVDLNDGLRRSAPAEGSKRKEADVRAAAEKRSQAALGEAERKQRVMDRLAAVRERRRREEEEATAAAAAEVDGHNRGATKSGSGRSRAPVTGGEASVNASVAAEAAVEETREQRRKNRLEKEARREQRRLVREEREQRRAEREIRKRPRDR